MIIPQLTSQYLNLTRKLVAGHRHRLPGPGQRVCRHDAEPDWTGGRGHRDDDGVYLLISLVISLFMNWYNKRNQLVER